MANPNSRLKLTLLAVFLVLSSFIPNTVLAKKNMISIEPEQGQWEVRKFKNGNSGACFESQHVLIIVFRRPGADKTSIRLVVKKGKPVSNPLVQGDTIRFSFDSMLPSDNNSHRWDNIL